MQETGGEAREYARKKVSGPAMALIVCCALSLTMLVLSLAFDVWLVAAGNAAHVPQPDGVSKITVRIAWNVAMEAANVVILLGAIRMMKLKSRGMAMAACILALVPCVGPCFVLGIPFGIWGLVVLNDARVRQAFQDGR